MKTLRDYLLAAAGAAQADIAPENPYREFGFDGDRKRLGWVKPAAFNEIKKALVEIEPVFAARKRFIFIGMGGSINGIKPLLALFDSKNYHTLDSLDPRAIKGLLSGVSDFNETQVIAISKSGTTTETQLLAATLRDVFTKKRGENGWRDHFMWLSDAPSFAKLDSLGWERVRKASIQFDAATDVGGRFSSPHTLIFLLPLFLLLRKDFTELEKIYQRFFELQERIQQHAYHVLEDYRHKADAYFSPCIDERLGESFSSWLVQLFQESLGSKCEGLEVKTITNLKDDSAFSPLQLDVANEHPVVSLFSQMYFFQLFIAFYAASKGANFVNQEYVEKYKQQMRTLKSQKKSRFDIAPADMDAIVTAVREQCHSSHRFVEIVLYFYPSGAYVESLKKRFQGALPDKRILVFIGSDWNHQSYQAAFGSNDTFYVLLTARDYPVTLDYVQSESLSRNIETLLLIAQATYITIKEKSVLFSVPFAVDDT